MHRVAFLLVIALFISEAQAQSLSVEALVREAQVSNALSDRFKSFRLMSFLKEKRSDAFFKIGVVEFLESEFRLTTTQKFIARCEEFSKTKTLQVRDTVYYTCGRLLLDSFNLQEAEKFLALISPKSPLAVQGSILQSTINLGDNDGESCLKRVNSKALGSIKESLKRDFFHITRARCFVETNQMDKAILQYQQIPTTSPLYFAALEETAWVQFKIRHLESARTLLDVIVTTHETGLGEKKSISAISYFRSRYLQAYIELVERNNQKAEQQFKSLRDAINNYTKQKLLPESKIRALATSIAKDNIKWIDMKAMPKDVASFMELVREWGDQRLGKRLDRSIDYQFSLSREVQRLRAQPDPEFTTYQKDIEQLEKKNAQGLETDFVRASRSIERALKVLKIKSDLGSIEIIWSQRAQGVRGIGELLETYQHDIDEVEDYFGTL